MNLIEEAAKRLLQLEAAGVAAPPGVHATGGGPAPAAIAEARPRAANRSALHRKLDLARLQAAGFVTPSLQDSPLLHEFRVIKRPLVRNGLGRTAMQARNSNLIMVTSALPGEGKTFVAVNLAMSLALEVDCRVLLVDADVISPSVPRVLGIEPAKGLMDLLTTKGPDMGDLLLSTNVEHLTLLLAGTPHPASSELLASEVMNRLLNEVASRYPDRIVVFDSPPLLATTESRVLATLMGQVVVVVEAERTTQGALQSALATVESCPAVYTVLNKAPDANVASYYGAYGYGR
jgi:receptor protein-tyrosine kinase